MPSNLVHFSTVQGSSIRVDCVPLLAKLTYLKSILDAHDIWVLKSLARSLTTRTSACVNPTKITSAHQAKTRTSPLARPLARVGLRHLRLQSEFF